MFGQSGNKILIKIKCQTIKLFFYIFLTLFKLDIRLESGINFQGGIKHGA